MCGLCLNIPKDPARAGVLARKAFLQRYKQEVPLTDADLEALEGDEAKFDPRSAFFTSRLRAGFSGITQAV